jgi:hypothetical protein
MRPREYHTLEIGGDPTRVALVVRVLDGHTGAPPTGLPRPPPPAATREAPRRRRRLAASTERSHTRRPRPLDVRVDGSDAVPVATSGGHHVFLARPGSVFGAGPARDGTDGGRDDVDEGEGPSGDGPDEERTGVDATGEEDGTDEEDTTEWRVLVRGGPWFLPAAETVDVGSLDPRHPVVEVVLRPAPAYPFGAHETLVRGRVRDGAGEGVAGATVTLDGTTLLGGTDDRGEFVLAVPVGAAAPTTTTAADRAGRRRVLVDGAPPTLRVTHPDRGTTAVEVDLYERETVTVRPTVE